MLSSANKEIVSLHMSLSLVADFYRVVNPNKTRKCVQEILLRGGNWPSIVARSDAVAQ